MQAMFTRFVAAEDGAVSVEFLPTIAAMVGLGVAVVGGVAIGIGHLAQTASDQSAEFEIVSVFAPVAHTPPSLAPTWEGPDGFMAPESGTIGIGDGLGGSGPDHLDCSVATEGCPDVPGPGPDEPANDGDTGTGGCQGVPGVSCSGLGDGTNPGQGSGNNNAGNTPGGQGVSNPNNSGGAGNQTPTETGGETQADTDAPVDPAGPDQPAPAAPEPDFVIAPTTITPGWSGTVVSPWLSLPGDIPVQGPIGFTAHGDGNPTLQTLNGRGSEGQIPSWGTNIHIVTPACGTTATAVIELENGLVGIWQVTRPPWPADWGAPPAGC